MPPKKKSKKVVSNRGFATTSVPRKKTEEEEAAAAAAAAELAFQETSDPSPTSAAAASSPPEGSGVNGSTTAEATTPGKDGEWDAEASERSELQALAEKVRPAAEKEISRAVKVRWTRQSCALVNLRSQCCCFRRLITNVGCRKLSRPTPGLSRTS